MNFLRAFLIVALLAISSLEGFSSPLERKMREYKHAARIAASFVQFRKLVGNVLPAEYMTRTYFLYNYLRNRNFDFIAAHQQIEEYVQWWKDENIAGIMDEDWTDLRSRFPYTLDTQDADGRPILYGKLDEWDIASYLNEVSVEPEKLFVRYLIMISEHAEYAMRQRRSDGADITSYRIIINAKGFTMEKHGCEQCFELYNEVAKLFKFVPTNKENPIITNVSPILKKALSQFSAYLSGAALFGEDNHKLIELLMAHSDMDAVPDYI